MVSQKMHTYLDIALYVHRFFLFDSCVIEATWRLLGAKLGSDCDLGSVSMGCSWDLIDIGDDVTLAGQRYFVLLW